ncbi:MAG: sugar kinase [Leptospiraceae bacterium]|nr:hypothetical protein [Leptospiraceae bacterium]MCP5500396.1 sugar kinase [Leptospiraceae bacterium]
MKGNQTVVIVRPKTALDEITARFGVARQAEFYMKQNKANFFGKLSGSITSKREESRKKIGSGEFQDLKKEKDNITLTIEAIQASLDSVIKTKVIERDFLPSYMFSDSDIVIVVGQDGLVANTAKYTAGLPLIGVNPDPERYDGVLLPFQLSTCKNAVLQVLENRHRFREVSMALVEMNDGQTLYGFNDVFIGPRSHTSARYSITFRDSSENHSSSGIIISTGAGSTGWLSSMFNMAKGICQAFPGTGKNHLSLDFDCRLNWDAEELRFIVREPFISRTSEASLIAGSILKGEKLILESNMSNNGVIFSDGIDSDFIQFNSGSIATISLAPQKAKLVII